ncbi:hypothetical protein DFJ73DRAFT_778227 [Zopfochytrium polystomum]|nr:hypothetical protein DFJ73DRAFT_778227 [Zopfochytrium polystomum]
MSPPSPPSSSSSSSSSSSFPSSRWRPPSPPPPQQQQQQRMSSSKKISASASFPAEIWLNILTSLSVRDLQAAQLVSRRLHLVARDVVASMVEDLTNIADTVARLKETFAKTAQASASGAFSVDTEASRAASALTFLTRRFGLSDEGVSKKGQPVSIPATPMSRQPRAGGRAAAASRRPPIEVWMSMLQLATVGRTAAVFLRLEVAIPALAIWEVEVAARRLLEHLPRLLVESPRIHLDGSSSRRRLVLVPPSRDTDVWIRAAKSKKRTPSAPLIHLLALLLDRLQAAAAFENSSNLAWSVWQAMTAVVVDERQHIPHHPIMIDMLARAQRQISEEGVTCFWQTIVDRLDLPSARGGRFSLKPIGDIRVDNNTMMEDDGDAGELLAALMLSVEALELDEELGDRAMDAVLFLPEGITALLGYVGRQFIGDGAKQCLKRAQSRLNRHVVDTFVVMGSIATLGALTSNCETEAELVPLIQDAIEAVDSLAMTYTSSHLQSYRSLFGLVRSLALRVAELRAALVRNDQSSPPKDSFPLSSPGISGVAQDAINELLTVSLSVLFSGGDVDFDGGDARLFRSVAGKPREAVGVIVSAVTALISVSSAAVRLSTWSTLVQSGYSLGSDELADIWGALAKELANSDASQEAVSVAQGMISEAVAAVCPSIARADPELPPSDELIPVNPDAIAQAMYKDRLTLGLLMLQWLEQESVDTSWPALRLKQLLDSLYQHAIECIVLLSAGPPPQDLEIPLTQLIVELSKQVKSAEQCELLLLAIESAVQSGRTVSARVGGNAQNNNRHQNTYNGIEGDSVVELVSWCTAAAAVARSASGLITPLILSGAKEFVADATGQSRGTERQRPTYILSTSRWARCRDTARSGGSGESDGTATSNAWTASAATAVWMAGLAAAVEYMSATDVAAVAAAYDVVEQYVAQAMWRLRPLLAGYGRRTWACWSRSIDTKKIGVRVFANAPRLVRVDVKGLSLSLTRAWKQDAEQRWVAVSRLPRGRRTAAAAEAN